MKKIKFVLLAVVFLTGILAKGQDSKFSIGFEGGPGISSLRGNESLENYFDPALSYSLGLSAEYALNDLISMRAGMAYEAKKVKNDITFTDMNGNIIGDSRFTEKFDYLTIPVMLRISSGKKARLFINAGPYLGILLNETGKSEAVGEYPGYKNNNTEYYKQFDCGLAGGLGALLPLNDKISLSAEVRDNLGLVNNSKLEIADGGTIKINNASLLVGLAYM